MPSAAATIVSILAAPLVAIWGIVRFVSSHGLVVRIRKHRVDELGVEGDQLVLVRGETRVSHPLTDFERGDAQLANYAGFASERGCGLLLTLSRHDGEPLHAGIPRYTLAIEDRVIVPLREAKLVGETRPMFAQLGYPTLGNLVELVGLALWIAVVWRLVA